MMQENLFSPWIRRTAIDSKVRMSLLQHMIKYVREERVPKVLIIFLVKDFKGKRLCMYVLKRTKKQR